MGRCGVRELLIRLDYERDRSVARSIRRGIVGIGGAFCAKAVDGKHGGRQRNFIGKKSGHRICPKEPQLLVVFIFAIGRNRIVVRVPVDRQQKLVGIGFQGFTCGAQNFFSGFA